MRPNLPARFQHVVLFTGHMIDAPGRTHPRFPASAEPAARVAIEVSLRSILETHPNPTLGIAGGASGGDILFHEVCQVLGIPTRLYLALPPDQYLQSSVAVAQPSATGQPWAQRFQALLARLGPAVYIFNEAVVLPEHPAHNEDLNLWVRTNLWMISEAISLAPSRTLLALWDGQSGDGPGGTEYLVSAAPSLGIDVFPPIATQSLFS